MSSGMLVKNLQDQLERLFTQLSDLEELRDELDDEEYEETRQETLDQLKEFQDSLDRTLAGDLTLESQLSAMKLATQAAISKAFKTPQVMRLFARQEPSQLRQVLDNLHRNIQLGKRSADDARGEKCEILEALQKLGAELTAEERLFLSNKGELGKGFTSVADCPAVGEHVLGRVQNQK